MRMFIVLMMLLPSIAFGDKLILGGFSKHFDETYPNPREVHPCIGYDREGYELAYCKNSLNRWSTFATKLSTPWYWKGLDVGYRFGLANNYESTLAYRYQRDNGQWVRKYTQDFKHGIRPILAPVVQKEWSNVTVDLMVSKTFILGFKFNLQ